MMSLSFDPSKLISGISDMSVKFDRAMEMFCKTACNQLQNDARKNAKWKDRTGDARKRLTCTTLKAATGYRLKLAHGVDYGIWLELAKEKRYAIIQETIRETGQTVIMPEFQEFMNKLR